MPMRMASTLITMTSSMMVNPMFCLNVFVVNIFLDPIGFNNYREYHFYYNGLMPFISDFILLCFYKLNRCVNL